MASVIRFPKIPISHVGADSPEVFERLLAELRAEQRLRRLMEIPPEEDNDSKEEP